MVIYIRIKTLQEPLVFTSLKTAKRYIRHHESECYRVGVKERKESEISWYTVLLFNYLY